MIVFSWLQVSGNEVLLVRPEHGLVFPAAEYIRGVIVTCCSTEERPDFLIVVDGTHVFTVDATMAKVHHPSANCLLTSANSVLP
ncbi:hypothetical protein PR048_024581 [Dryococelus australis]|uniref:Uncharacterized protein n=1 Tax=Dryococelus australis TaxID=614101 RepID=A0ABQ9GNY3_9NEOP|nr:hypothetical protein PR048_024581 [Dryococelus australis]